VDIVAPEMRFPAESAATSGKMMQLVLLTNGRRARGFEALWNEKVSARASICTDAVLHRVDLLTPLLVARGRSLPDAPGASSLD